jgi:hypothetical protein
LLEHLVPCGAMLHNYQRPLNSVVNYDHGYRGLPVQRHRAT